MSESLHGLAYSISRVPGASVLTLQGEIDLATGQDFSAQLDEARSASDHSLVVDMTSIDFLGSAGLAALIKFQDDAVRKGIAVYLVCGPAARRTIELTGLTARFRLADTAAAAVEESRAQHLDR